MKKQIIIGLFSIMLILLASCDRDDSQKHFLQDNTYRAKVETQFQERQQQYKDITMFQQLDSLDLSLQEKEALMFLYAYMPLSDIADFDQGYFVNQVKGAFRAQEYFDWGKTIPDYIFRHFVLVYRVNNEDLDGARDVFFDELKDRVKGMSMKDAALEVNHWCHEKITYRGTDGRTSAPLALMNTSWGRCGEQSVFTVTALRSVGIPARQCYTPRWVHTDSNHAWVEVWIDGEWHYMGASEPEPELDVAWFDRPVKRAMMVHTNVFGDYDGPEDKTSQTDLFSIINVLDVYADTREVEVTIIDQDNNPIQGANIDFEVYNFASYSPIASLQTGQNGKVKLKTNREGDILVWANKGNKLAYKKIEASDLNNTLVLDVSLPVEDETLVMHVPAEKSAKELSKEALAKNAILLAKEDSIRNAYMATFITASQAKEFAKNNNLNQDIVWNILSLSQGNWKEISAFIEENKNNPFVLNFLQTLSEKDLRDTPKKYLQNHFINAENLGVPQDISEEIKLRYIYSPHIDRELIRPWRVDLQKVFTEEQIADYKQNPSSLIDYVKQNIDVTSTENYFRCPISPDGVYKTKKADLYSRNIFFVAMSRSLGIPARIDLTNGRPQYYDQGWKDVFLETPEQNIPKSTINFTNDPNNLIKPSYMSQFGIAKFEDGKYKAMNLAGEVGNLPGSAIVDGGMYRLVIGSRANDGSVTVQLRYFEAPENKVVTEKITLPIPENLLQVQGIVDPNTIVQLGEDNKTTLKELMNNKGLMLVFADPDKEPTKHILQDLPQVSQAFNEWGGGILFLVPDDKLSTAFDATAFKGLPAKNDWGVDRDRQLLHSVASTLQIDFTNNFPLVIYINTNGGILYSHVGYTIGIGEKVLETILQEKKSLSK